VTRRRQRLVGVVEWGGGWSGGGGGGLYTHGQKAKI